MHRLIRGGIQRYNFTDKFGRKKFKETSLEWMFNRREDIYMDRSSKPMT